MVSDVTAYEDQYFIKIMIVIGKTVFLLVCNMKEAEIVFQITGFAVRIQFRFLLLDVFLCLACFAMFLTRYLYYNIKVSDKLDTDYKDNGRLRFLQSVCMLLLL